MDTRAVALSLVLVQNGAQLDWTVLPAQGLVWSESIGASPRQRGKRGNCGLRGKYRFFLQREYIVFSKPWCEHNCFKNPKRKIPTAPSKCGKVILMAGIIQPLKTTTSFLEKSSTNWPRFLEWRVYHVRRLCLLGLRVDGQRLHNVRLGVGPTSKLSVRILISRLRLPNSTPEPSTGERVYS